MSRNRLLLLIAHCSLLVALFTSSDEVDNLYAVAFGQAGVRPIDAANDFAVALKGKALGGERELPDEAVERRARLNFACFSVDFDAQKLD